MEPTITPIRKTETKKPALVKKAAAPVKKKVEAKKNPDSMTDSDIAQAIA